LLGKDMIQYAKARGALEGASARRRFQLRLAPRVTRKKQTACKVEHIPLHYCALSAPLTPVRADGRLRRG
jgi:hypothetical protein